ncbi:hypothetical protein DNH61_06245 [Paenibacillus sambharensis]|uniref:Dipeptide epimerase n=1 Tax=Paenibacillus sambharensis TaxID=1803190 RepID=A0A2W1LQK6_9BACL|nr:dipeptide epimerase [Paenibacillus sambharensis]PZD96794.1 hypothetical protein DNH61_06245 [Paenibacillus sambharensis]
MKLSYQLISMRLKEPFISNKGTQTSVTQTLVSLQCGELTGLGTAVYAKEYGMTADKVAEALDRCSAVISGASPFEGERILRDMEAVAGDQPTAIAAVDIAVQDLVAKLAGEPLHRMWGLAGLPLPPTAVSLGSLPEEQLLARAEQWRDWPILKLKMTRDFKLDTLKRLRETYNGRIWVDGNGLWSKDEAVHAAEYMAMADVELLEQPIPSGSLEQLRYVSERSPIPVIADEDCRSPRDVLQLAGCVQGINIKLLKCGGLTRAMEMARMAKHYGLRVMLGCKTESVLGITAVAQLGGLADYLDADGHMDLLDDPYKGLTVDRGMIILPENPGLGVERKGAVVYE